jgi:hypothetical protein
MEEKASNLDEENKMLRQAVASIPTIKSPLTENREAPNTQESPENEKTPNGAVKPITVDREGNIHVCMSLQPLRSINTFLGFLYIADLTIDVMDF